MRTRDAPDDSVRKRSSVTVLPRSQPSRKGPAMAISRKGYRRIVVDGVTFLWKTPRKAQRSDWEGDPGFVVLVQSEDRKGPALAIHFPQRHPAVAVLFGTPVVPVVPSEVAAAIR